jgi:hypothetical protein
VQRRRGSCREEFTEQTQLAEMLEMLEAAGAALVAGEVDRAHELAKDALNLLPVALQRERAAARNLQRFLETLL